MSPLAGELWRFDSLSKTFELVEVGQTLAGEQPEDRSYHVLTNYEVRCCPPLQRRQGAAALPAVPF